MRYTLPIFILLLWSSNSTANTQCNLTPTEFQKYLMMDYHSFDQSLPDGGWRGVSNRGCNLEAGQLIDTYHLQHLDDLAPWQDRVLYWHAGQVYALDGSTDVAVGRFKKSLNPEETPDDSFRWNAYTNGSIAFLSHNLNDLMKYRNELSKASDPHAKINLNILNRMVNCFDKTYAEVYQPSQMCGP